MNVTAAQLKAKRDKPNTAEVHLPGVGVITVRGLSRRESMKLKSKRMPEDELEIELLTLAMVEPAMSRHDVEEWYESGANDEFDIISQKIAELSGMEIRADKAAYKSV